MKPWHALFSFGKKMRKQAVLHELPKHFKTFGLFLKRNSLVLLFHVVNRTNWLFADPETSIVPDELQQVRVAIVKRSSCISSYGAIPSNTICAGDFSLGGVDTCSVSMIELFCCVFV